MCDHSNYYVTVTATKHTATCHVCGLKWILKYEERDHDTND